MPYEPVTREGRKKIGFRNPGHCLPTFGGIERMKNITRQSWRAPRLNETGEAKRPFQTAGIPKSHTINWSGDDWVERGIGFLIRPTLSAGSLERSKGVDFT